MEECPASSAVVLRLSTGFLPCAVLMPAAKAATEGSAVSLLPSGVRASLSYTKGRKEKMKQQLEPLISNLQPQFEAYKTLSCDGSTNQGCQQTVAGQFCRV